MTIDWFVIFTPAAVTVICLLFLFVGCTPFKSGSATPPTSTQPPTTPPSGTPGSPPVVPPPVVPAPPMTVLQLNPGATLQDIAPGLPNKAVTRIDVTFELTENLKPATPALDRSGSIINPVGGPIVPTDSTAVFEEELTDAVVGTRDSVRCACVVTVTDAAGVDEKITVLPEDAILNKDGMNKFWLEPAPPPNPKKPTRTFQVNFDAAGK